MPVEPLLAVTPRLWVVYHHHDDWTMAFYRPSPDAPEAAARTPDLSFQVLAGSGGVERPLAGLRVPRLVVYAPYYRSPTAGPSVLEMPVDVAQYYFQALLEASFDLAIDAGLAELAAARADVLLAEIPAGQRAGVYAEALAAFGAHALATAVEVRRSLARQRVLGKDPCRAVDLPSTLFGLWRRIFTDEAYAGLFRPAAAPAEGWRPTPPLARADKELLMARVFQGFWTGDPRRDFHLDCPL